MLPFIAADQPLPDLAWCLRFAHLLALALGLGSALACDMLVLRRAVLRPITPATVTAVEAMAGAVRLGLFGLWVTGAAILGWAAARGINLLAKPKVVLKVAVVIALSANAGLVHGFALPHLAANVGRRFHDGLGLRAHAGHAGIAALSVTCWLVPAALGLVKAFERPDGAAVAATAILALAGAVFLGVLGLGLWLARGPRGLLTLRRLTRRLVTRRLAHSRPLLPRLLPRRLRAPSYDVALDEALARPEARVA